MNQGSEVVQLCIQGTRAEYAGRVDEARSLYAQAWELAASNADACIAAHYVAHLQDDLVERLRWNQIALDRADAADAADAVNQEEVKTFYPSLYLNMGQSHELLGHAEEAQKFYNLAASFGANHNEEQRLCRK